MGRVSLLFYGGKTKTIEAEFFSALNLPIQPVFQVPMTSVTMQSALAEPTNQSECPVTVRPWLPGSEALTGPMPMTDVSFEIPLLASWLHFWKKQKHSRIGHTSVEDFPSWRTKRKKEISGRWSNTSLIFHFRSYDYNHCSGQHFPTVDMLFQEIMHVFHSGLEDSVDGPLKRIWDWEHEGWAVSPNKGKQSDGIIQWWGYCSDEGLTSTLNRHGLAQLTEVVSHGTRLFQH